MSNSVTGVTSADVYNVSVGMGIDSYDLYRNAQLFAAPNMEMRGEQLQLESLIIGDKIAIAREPYRKEIREQMKQVGKEVAAKKKEIYKARKDAAKVEKLRKDLEPMTQQLQGLQESLKTAGDDDPTIEAYKTQAIKVNESFHEIRYILARLDPDSANLLGNFEVTTSDLSKEREATGAKYAQPSGILNTVTGAIGGAPVIGGTFTTLGNMTRLFG